MTQYIVSWNSKDAQRADGSYVNIQDCLYSKKEAERYIESLKEDKKNHGNFNIELTVVK